MRRSDTAIKKAEFLLALQEKCSVFHAAKTAGVGRRTVYRWRDKDRKFAQGWDDALDDAVDTLEASLYERALKGDTTAAIFLLKARRPGMYRDSPQAKAQAQIMLVKVGDKEPRPVKELTTEELEVAYRELGGEEE